MGALSGTQRGSPIYSAYSLKRNKKNYDGRMIQIQQDLSPKSQKMQEVALEWTKKIPWKTVTDFFKDSM